MIEGTIDEVYHWNIDLPEYKKRLVKKKNTRRNRKILKRKRAKHIDCVIRSVNRTLYNGGEGRYYKTVKED